MGQVKVQSSFVASPHRIQGEIRKLAKQISLERKLARRMTEVLAKLRASERHKVLDIIRQQHKNGELNYSWLISFLTSLSKLKTEESQSEAE